MNELSLFTGAGGGVLGSKLLGHRMIGYVEFNKYCQKVIRQRIEDGFLDAAPIFTDIRDFISEGYAASYTGMVDVITAGFPCQPFSVAGQQRGADDPRNMWPSTIECIRIIRPRIAFLENVPGLLANEYIRTIYGDLAEAGYDARWCVLGADDCGCCHRRKRVWIVAHSLNSEHGAKRGQIRETDGLQGINREALRSGRIERTDRHAPDTGNPGLQGSEETGNIGIDRTESRNELTGRCSGWQEPWLEAATRLCRMDDEVASRVDRLKAIGNGQVSVVAATAFKILTRDLI